MCPFLSGAMLFPSLALLLAVGCAGTDRASVASVLVSRVMDPSNAMWSGAGARQTTGTPDSGLDYMLAIDEWKTLIDSYAHENWADLHTHIYLNRSGELWSYSVIYHNFKLYDNLDYSNEGGLCPDGHCPNGPQMQAGAPTNGQRFGRWYDGACCCSQNNAWGWYNHCGFSQFGTVVTPGSYGGKFSHPINKNGVYTSPPVGSDASGYGEIVKKEHWLHFVVTTTSTTSTATTSTFTTTTVTLSTSTVTTATNTSTATASTATASTATSTVSSTSSSSSITLTSTTSSTTLTETSTTTATVTATSTTSVSTTTSSSATRTGTSTGSTTSSSSSRTATSTTTASSSSTTLSSTSRTSTSTSSSSRTSTTTSATGTATSTSTGTATRTRTSTLTSTSVSSSTSTKTSTLTKTVTGTGTSTLTSTATSGTTVTTTVSTVTGTRATVTITRSTVTVTRTTVTTTATTTTGSSTTETRTSMTDTRTSMTDTRTSMTETRTSMTEMRTSTTVTRTSVQALASNASAEKAFAVQQAASSGVAELLAGNASSLSKATDLGVVTVVSLEAALAGKEAAAFGTGTGSRVSMPQGVLRSLPQGAVLAMLDVEDSGNGDAFAGLGPLAAKVLDVSVYDADGQPVKVRSSTPLLLKLPGSEATNAASCVYLERGGLAWSTEGVWRASDAEVLAAGETPGGVWCFSTHLSIFSALLDVVLGCTNLELLSAEALRSVAKNEGWYAAESAAIVFFIWSLLLLAVVVGNVRERWALRLGRTHDAGKAVSICKSFMAWGPQVLKHRYAAFLVYAKDLFQTLTTHRSKLKTSSLTASVQRFLAVRTGISVACVSQHCWNGGAWVESKASMPYTVLCRKLEFYGGAAEKVILEDICARGPCGVLRRFLMTLLAVHPLLDAMRIGAGSLTVGKRTSLQVAGICGVLATNALIFNFSGSLQSWEADAACPIDPASHFFILVATVVSVVVNAVPNAFLMNLAKQVHGRPLWTAAFWLLAAAYLSLAVLFIIVTLSNMNRKDQAKWYSSLEWSMSIKLLGMPLAQCLRHLLLLEIFLRHDRGCKPTQRFRVIMGLSHPNESQLSNTARAEAEELAGLSISAQELVHFLALLGVAIMPDFDPAISTSDDVVHGAIAPLCVKLPPLDEYPVSVEVAEGTELPWPGPLSCSVLHLGALARQERACIKEERGQALEVEGGQCCWALEAELVALMPEHVLAFAVADADGRSLGTAWLSAEEVLRGDGWSGELRLQNAEKDSWSRMPAEAARVPARHIKGSRGSSEGGQPRLAVKVRLPEGYCDALAGHECQRLSILRPRHESEFREAYSELRTHLVKSRNVVEMGEGVASRGAFCCAQIQSRCPPERMVVHSRKGRFSHLVASILTDALGEPAAYKAVLSKIQDRDFHGLLDMLREAGCEGMRYWIEMFAVDPREHRKDGWSNWHEDFLSSWPTVLRTMRRDSCSRAVLEIEAGNVDTFRGPLQQLLVLDENFHFLREMGCLAELMLARAMHVRQRLQLHPSHLKGAGLGEELQRLAEALGRAYQDKCYIAPFIEDRQKVYDAMKDLVLASVKEQKEDQPETWQELSLTNVAATVAAVRIQRSEPQEMGQAEGVDMDADV